MRAYMNACVCEPHLDILGVEFIKKLTVLGLFTSIVGSRKERRWSDLQGGYFYTWSISVG